MRDFKFRVWCKNKNEWERGSVVLDKSGHILHLDNRSCRFLPLKTGTIFAGSKIPLKKWYLAIFLLTSYGKRISSVRLAEELGVTQKTAWFMDYRIRETNKRKEFIDV